MPIKEIMTVASLVLGGLIVTHPLTWRSEIRKVQFSILREVTSTRSWGNPSIFVHRATAKHVGRSSSAEAQAFEGDIPPSNYKKIR